ncbi:MAG: leucyl/phenylalanyl-tRNA--protein transferase [Pseudobdellovibrionaceae bacterium]
MARTPSFEFVPDELQVDGLVGIGGQLDVDTLKWAYAQGIFPWPQEGLPWLWFSPDPRGVLDFKDLKIAKSLQKFRRQHRDWNFTVNQNFPAVIKNCAQQRRPGQKGTWILPDMITAYENLLAAGHLISVEVWAPSLDGNQELIGGIYGVLSEKYFSAESMFYKVSNASKLAFCYLLELLQEQGLTWMDVQMITPLTEAFGGKYISRNEFLQRIR